MHPPSPDEEEEEFQEAKEGDEHHHEPSPEDELEQCHKTLAEENKFHVTCAPIQNFMRFVATSLKEIAQTLPDRNFFSSAARWVRWNKAIEQKDLYAYHQFKKEVKDSLVKYKRDATNNDPKGLFDTIQYALWCRFYVLVNFVRNHRKIIRTTHLKQLKEIAVALNTLLGNIFVIKEINTQIKEATDKVLAAMMEVLITHDGLRKIATNTYYFNKIFGDEIQHAYNKVVADMLNQARPSGGTRSRRCLGRTTRAKKANRNHTKRGRKTTTRHRRRQPKSRK